MPNSTPPDPRPDAPQGKPRLQRPERHQLGWQALELDGLIPLEHRARAVWEYVEGLDLSAFEEDLRAVEGHAGRPAIDPAILVALWLYATLEGVGSARALERLCESHDAYRWICGGVGVNHHTLPDFRAGSGEELDGLLPERVATLVGERLARLGRVAPARMRGRAEAGSASSRSRRSLNELRGDARARIRELRRELDDDPQGPSRRERAARERAAKERAERLGRALRARAKLERARK